MTTPHANPDANYASVTAPRTVRLQRLLPGPPERVWAYLTDSNLRRQWLASGDMPASEGSAFAMTWRNDELTDPPGRKPEGFGSEHTMDSTVVEYDAPRRLVFTWGGGDVAFDLQPQGDQVLLTVTHRGISDRHNMVMIGAGWHQHLDTLAARVSDTAPEPFWDGWTRLRDEYEDRIPA
ncbi:SRPBCC family protein [Thermomonas sp. HDW16]|uniref:SRPBCC family protein n=1 Tax=Thermomonas sp. HDW16 TaxID=2714945 RepID=UPI001408C3F6|nr:SRPBCC family protein [Thermomonas sp. HDW16]QIL19424.1 SRPBCC family protein [Thermomonas sp. HDW16]